MPGTVLGTWEPTESENDKTSVKYSSAREVGGVGKGSLEVNGIISHFIGAVRAKAEF